MSKKMPLGWERIARRILIRDAYICAICGRKGARSVDHIIPRSKGGTNAPNNLRAAHVGCNSRKGNRVIDMKPRPSRWA